MSFPSNEIMDNSKIGNLYKGMGAYRQNNICSIWSLLAFTFKLEPSELMYGNIIYEVNWHTEHLANYTHDSHLVVLRCVYASINLTDDLFWQKWHHLTGKAITIINFRLSDDRLQFIMGIAVSTKRCLLSQWMPIFWTISSRHWGNHGMLRLPQWYEAITMKS